MGAFLSEIVTVSVQGGIVILAVMLLRLALKKVPKSAICLLWLLAGLRLLLPFQIESSFSLQPDRDAVTRLEWTAAESEIPPARGEILDKNGDVIVKREPSVPAKGEILDKNGEVLIEKPLTPAPAKESWDWKNAIPFLWLAGVLAMGIYTAVSYWRLKRQVSDAVILEEGVWISNRIDTPFLLGFVHPKIYLPLGMTEWERPYVLAHERAHLARRDHWWKLLGFAALALHWFNPLVWVGYVLLCRDLEMACDEAVVKSMDVAHRKAYSAALLACSARHPTIAACPVAFAEVSVKDRIRNVLNYKKPGFWIMLLAAAAILFVAVFFLTSPGMTKDEVLENLYQQIEQLQSNEIKHLSYTIEIDSDFEYITEQHHEVWVSGEDWYHAIVYETPMGVFTEDYMQLDGIQYATDHSDEIEGFENRPWAEIPEENYSSLPALLRKDFSKLEVVELREENLEDGGKFSIVLRNDSQATKPEKIYQDEYTFRLDGEGELIGISKYCHQNAYMRGFGQEGYFETKSNMESDILDFDMAEYTKKVDAACGELGLIRSGSAKEAEILDGLYAEIEKLQTADAVYWEISAHLDGEYDYCKGQEIEIWKCGDNWYNAMTFETTEGVYSEYYLQIDDTQYVSRESEEISRLDSQDWTIIPEEYQLKLYPLLTKDWTQCEILDIREETTGNGGMYTVVFQGDLEGSSKITYYEHTYSLYLDEQYQLAGCSEYYSCDRYMVGHDGTEGRYDMEVWTEERIQLADPEENAAVIEKMKLAALGKIEDTNALSQAELEALLERKEAERLAKGIPPDLLWQCQRAVEEFQSRDAVCVMMDNQYTGDIGNDSSTMEYYRNGKDWLIRGAIEDDGGELVSWAMEVDGEYRERRSSEIKDPAYGEDWDTGWVADVDGKPCIPWLSAVKWDELLITAAKVERQEDLTWCHLTVYGSPYDVEEVKEYQVTFVFRGDVFLQVILEYTKTWDDGECSGHVVSTMRPETMLPEEIDKLIEMVRSYSAE